MSERGQLEGSSVGSVCLAAHSPSEHRNLQSKHMEDGSKRTRSLRSTVVTSEFRGAGMWKNIQDVTLKMEWNTDRSSHLLKNTVCQQQVEDGGEAN